MAQKARKAARGTSQSATAGRLSKSSAATAAEPRPKRVAVAAAAPAPPTVSVGPSDNAALRVWRTLRGIHPGLVLAFLDAVGLFIASFLSYQELNNQLVPCGPFGNGCHIVQQSQYAWIDTPFGKIPVAVFGVFLSITLFILAIAWWRTNRYELLIGHYGLSLVGVLFEGWFQFAQFFLIHAFCPWCEAYGISLILRFVIAAWVYFRTPNPNATVPARAGGKLA